MSFKVWHFKILVGLAIFGLALLQVCQVQAQTKRRNRAIEFSEPKTGESATNLTQLNTKKESLKQLEEDLFRPLQDLAKGSMSGVAAPPRLRVGPAPVISNRRVRELLDQRKNWIFANPDELAAGPTPESIFNLPEYDSHGQEKQKGSLFESFYEHQRPGNNSAKGKQGDKNPSADVTASKSKFGNDDNDEDSQLPGQLRHRQEDLRKQLSGSDSGSRDLAPSVSHDGLASVFGLDDSHGSLADDLAEKERLKEYKDLLDKGTLTATPASMVNSLAPTTPDLNPTPALVPTMDSLSASPRHGAFDSLSTAGNSAWSTPSLPDVNKSLTMWNPLTPSLPKLDPLKPISSTVMFPEFPRRKGL